jgi:hypothetical protein
MIAETKACSSCKDTAALHQPTCRPCKTILILTGRMALEQKDYIETMDLNP